MYVSVPPINFVRDFMGLPLSATVDLSRDSDNLGTGVGKQPTVVIESGDLGCNIDEFIVIGNKTRQMREKVWTDSERNKFKISEGLEAF